MTDRRSTAETILLWPVDDRLASRRSGGTRRHAASHRFHVAQALRRRPARRGDRCAPGEGAGQLSSQCAAASGRLSRAGLQRARWGVARHRRQRLQAGGRACRRRTDASATACIVTHLCVCPAETCAARLHGAEGGGDGRGPAAAGYHPAHSGVARQPRTHDRQCDRGGGTMRGAGRAGGPPRDAFRGLAADLARRATPGVLRRRGRTRRLARSAQSAAARRRRLCAPRSVQRAASTRRSAAHCWDGPMFCACPSAHASCGPTPPPSRP